MTDTIELAHESGFSIGRVTVRPAQRELVRDDGKREVLEHRVMQVLIVLSRSAGSIITRDELMARCWQGRIVGEDAVNRVMSRLRKAARGIGEGSFNVETIAKVGYRLVQDGAGQDPRARPSAPHSVSRRAMLAAGAAVGAAGLASAGALIYARARSASQGSEAEALTAQAWTAWTQGNEEGNAQAIGLYQRLLKDAPRVADNWGLLACAYADRAQAWASAIEREPVRQRARTAGQRALELDGRNAYGRAAIAYARPAPGNWGLMETEFRRAISDQPGKSLVPYSLGLLYTNVGRYSDAAAVFETIAHIAPTPRQYRLHVLALWGAGRLEEAERLLDEAMTIFGRRPGIWFSRFEMLLVGGRAMEAMAMAQNTDTLPSGVSVEYAAHQARLAAAVHGREPRDIDAVEAVERRNGRLSQSQAGYAIKNLSVLDRLDPAFELADALFFSRGFSIPDVPIETGQPSGVSLPERQGDFLFHASTQAMRHDPRFGRLVDALGLRRYWAESRSQPDYLRREL